MKPLISYRLRMRKVLYVYGRERGARFGRWQAGDGPDEFMYGYNHFSPSRFDMAFIAKDIRRWSWRRLLWEPFERVISWQVGMGFSLHIALEHSRALRDADVIVSTVDSVGLPIAALRWLGWHTTPIIYFSQGLSDRVQAIASRPLRRFFQRWYARLLAECEAVLVLGEGAVTGLQEQFGSSPLAISVVPFGVDSDFWRPGDADPRREFVLSVGSDKGRDYPTLLAALAGQDLTIVTFQSIPAGKRWPQLRVGSQFSDVELRTLYQTALCVVIPLFDVAQPSGQSAALQAMACGKAVVLTKTKGLWEPAYMRHLDNCYLVPPGRPEAIREAVDFFRRHPEQGQAIGQRARQMVLERYSSQHFARAIMDVLEKTSAPA